MPSQEETLRHVGNLSACWDKQQERMDAVTCEVETLESTLAAARARVSDLIEERKSAPRSDISAISDNIRWAKIERDGVARVLNAARVERTAVRMEQRRTQADARSLSRNLRGDLAKLLSSRDRIRGGVAPHSVGEVVRITEQVKRALDFESKQINALSRIVGSGGTVIEPEYVYDPPSWYALTPEKLLDGGVHLLESIDQGVYETVDGSACVPTEAWIVYDSLNTSGMNTQQKALAYAEAVLRTQGHSPVFPLDGPSLPDMPSLNAGRLCISEVKGTDVSGVLPSSGLQRRFADGSSLMENSTEWLLRDLGGGRSSLSQTLDAMDRAITACNDPAERLELGHLRERYVESARDGFSPLTCDRQVIQVGFQKQGDYLKPPEAFGSRRLDDYVREANNKLVQVNVMEGSSQAPGLAADSGEISPIAMP